MKFAYFTDEPPTPGTLLYTAFRRNMPRELKEVTIRNPVTFFYGIQQTGGLLNIQVRWINPDGALARTSDQPMGQSREPDTVGAGVCRAVEVEQLRGVPEPASLRPVHLLRHPARIVDERKEQ